MLCREMDLFIAEDMAAIEPDIFTINRALVLPLDRAKCVNTKIEYPAYLLPQSEYDALWADEEEPPFDD